MKLSKPIELSAETYDLLADRARASGTTVDCKAEQLLTRALQEDKAQQQLLEEIRQQREALAAIPNFPPFQGSERSDRHDHLRASADRIRAMTPFNPTLTPEFILSAKEFGRK